MVFQNYHDRDGYIWMDGKMLPWREAKIHFLTHALHYGTQVFEGERAYEGKIFESVKHSERLANSAEKIRMEVTFTTQELEDIKREVLKANNLDNAYIRAAAWRGSEAMGIDVTGTKTHLAVAAWDWSRYFSKEIREKGIALGSTGWAKPAPNTAPTEAKTASLYNLGCIAKYDAQQKGFNDAFMLDYEGYVAESTGANIFFSDGESLITPIADRFLNGITRQTVIKLAMAMGLSVEEKRIKPEEITHFKECFITGTAAEITPVGRIDDHEYGVGELTLKIHEEYENFVRA